MPNGQETMRAEGRYEGERRREDPGGSEGGGGKTSRWEWLAAGIGALLVLGAIGFTLYQAVTEPDQTLPRLAISVDSIATYSGGHVVMLTVRNDGAATAAAVVVEGEIRSDSGTIERSNTTIDYVPAGSRRRAGLLFTADPRRHRLEVRPLGYDDP